MNRIREKLCLQAESHTRSIDHAIFSLNICNKVTSIELYTGKRGICLHHTAALRSSYRGKMAKCFVIVIHDPVMIISLSKQELLIRSIDILSIEGNLVLANLGKPAALKISIIKIAVKVISSLIDRKLNHLTVNVKAAALNTIRVRSNHGT